MFELLKLLVESLLKGFSFENLTDKDRKKLLAEVGTEIFLSYSSINEILVVGEMITSELERASRFLAEKERAGELDRSYSTRLTFLLPQLGNNILKFQASLKRLALEFQVIAPDVYSQIAPLIHGKVNALSRIVDSLVGNYLQSVALSAADMPRLKEVLASGHPEASASLQAGERPYGGRQRGHAFLERMGEVGAFYSDLQIELSNHITRVEVPNLGFLGQDAALAIRNYLEQENPRARLGEIKELAHKLRESIKEHFALQDILLEVGDHRVANNDPWVID